MEISSFLSGNLFSWAEIRSPFYLKIFKDIFLIICLILSGKYLSLVVNRKLLVYDLLVIVFLFSALVSLLFIQVGVVLLGIRSYWNFMLVFVGYVYNKIDLNKISFSLRLIFLLHFILQIVEMIYAPDIFGDKVFGLNLRNPGVFMIPGIGGAFALFCYYYFSQINKKAYKSLAVISLLLSNSTIGLLIFISYLSIKYMRRLRYWYLLTPVILLGIVIVIINLGVITGRGEGVWISAFARVDVMKRTFMNLGNIFIGQGLGIATSGALLFNLPQAIVPDNTFAGVYLNMGIMGLVLVVMIFVFIVKKMPLLIVLMFLGYGMTLLIFEMSPVIQLLMIFVGTYSYRYDHMQRNSQKEKITVVA